MQLKKRGIVAQIENGFCIIINKEGTFERIPMPAAKVSVGEEITYSNHLIASAVKPVLLVASFLIVFLAYAFIHQATVPEAIAYVSVDINPSLEIAVDKNLNVLSVNCLNQDAVNLLKHEKLKGKNIYNALGLISQKAVKQHYIKADQENLIVSTVAASDNNTRLIDNNKIEQSLANSVRANGMNSQIKIYSVSPELRTTAKKVGLSPAKFIVYEQLKAAGNQVTIDDVKKSKIIDLSRKYSLELLPNKQKIKINPDKKLKKTELLLDHEGHGVPISALKGTTKLGEKYKIPKNKGINNNTAASSQKNKRVIKQVLPNPKGINNPAVTPSQKNRRVIKQVLPKSKGINNPAASFKQIPSLLEHKNLVKCHYNKAGLITVPNQTKQN